MLDKQEPKAVRVGVADVSPNRRRGGDLRILLGPQTVGSTSGFMGVLVLEPGEYVSEHYHPYSEEFLYVTHGDLTVRVEGEPVELSADQGLMVPIGRRHRVENRSPRRSVAVSSCARSRRTPALATWTPSHS